jgi:hypothetical protein
VILQRRAAGTPSKSKLVGDALHAFNHEFEFSRRHGVPALKKMKLAKSILEC